MSSEKKRIEESGVRTIKGRWSEWSIDENGLDCAADGASFAGLSMDDLAWLIEPHREALLPSTPAAKAGDGWIRCSERLPESGQIVVFWCAGWSAWATPGIGRFFSSGEDEYFEDETEDEGYYDDRRPRRYLVKYVVGWVPVLARPSQETNGD